MNYTVVSYFDVLGEEWESLSQYHSNTRRKNKYIRGGLYRLRSKGCVDASIFQRETFLDKTYRLVAIVHNIGEMPFNGLVMHQISGKKDNMSFTLSKDQCRILHLKFQKGLEVFPMSTAFERIVEHFPNKKFTFDSSGPFCDYCHCTVDGTIRNILVRLDDLKACRTKTEGDYRIVHRTNKKFTYKLTKGQMLGGITVKSKTFLKTVKNNLIFKKNEGVDYIISVDDETLDVYLQIVTVTNIKGWFTEDGYIGISKELIGDVKFEDLFSITDNRERI